MASDVEIIEHGRTKRRILELRVRSWSYRAIADELGISINTVRKYYLESIAENLPEEERKEAITLELAKLDESEARCLELIRMISERAAAASKAKELIKDGQGAKDPVGWAATLIAQQEAQLVAIRNRRSILGGYNAPNINLHNHRVRMEFDAEIEALAAELLGGGKLTTPPDMVLDEQL